MVIELEKNITALKFGENFWKVIRNEQKYTISNTDLRLTRQI